MSNPSNDCPPTDPTPSPAPVDQTPKISVPNEKPFIEVRENGPFLVHNVRTLRGPDGSRVETEAVFALCRCGGSGNKPFCDGTHKRNGFSGARTIRAPLDRKTLYQGREITVYDNRTICSHAEHCIHDVPEVFRKGARPWIDPDASQADEIIALMQRCPSGALTGSRAGETIPEPVREPEIAVERGGPYRIAGRIELSGELQPPVRERFTLCRCGQSRNKPFCDGAHHEATFDL